MEAAHGRKVDRYASLTDDIKEAGYNCRNIPSWVQGPIESRKQAEAYNTA